ncbi:MAG: GAF domain-containing protein [Actinomycetota bacterium]|nr:GAF domain-containing protein [Actinomycetota bacterium]
MLAAPVPAFDRAAGDRVNRLERLLAAGRTLTSELDLPSVLGRILETARELTGARYAALGVLDDRRSVLAEFLTVGTDERDREAIGNPPHGQGILKLLIDGAEPIRRRGVLGGPITFRAQAWGGLYLVEKQDAANFDDDDVDTTVVLADWAATAIDNARLSADATTRGHDLERALRTMRTAMEIATAIGGDTDLTHILELIVQRARTLVDADGLLIWLRHGDQLRIAAVAGNADVPVHATIPLGASTAGKALRAGRSVRVEDAQGMLISPAQFGMPQASSSLIVPLLHRGRGLGVLVAFDRLGATASFGPDNERALEAFAASAATAVATARLVEAQRLHDSIVAAESERGRWARELHDETLQGLASLKLLLAGTLKAEPARARTVIESAVAQLEHDIAALRKIIADLRPAALDELGLEPALRTLIAGVAEAAGLEARVTIAPGIARLASDVETIAYRVAQEALTNVVKHADARIVAVELMLEAEKLHLIVADDGRGIGEVQNAGLGIVGMRERAALASGVIEIVQASGGGTRVTLELPLAD